MTPLRSPDLQLFLTAAEAAIRLGSGGDGSGVDRSGVDGAAHAAGERIFAALRTPSPQAGGPGTDRLPVCGHLAPALAQVRGQAGPVGALADAFAGIEPRLHWKVRPGAATHGEGFLNGHANATIVGSEGLELRRDVWIGVSLMAPNTRYPDHRHPPEEVYVVLSEGEWRQADDPWHAPGIGGLVYNPANIVHAMRSTERPLLALWFLWTEQNNP
ncbi:MAG: dimethylsulfonioproprionate lyase family protein [Acetobacteraceae bacterium]